jgi:hypothetical protein
MAERLIALLHTEKPQSAQAASRWHVEGLAARHKGCCSRSEHDWSIWSIMGNNLHVQIHVTSSASSRRPWESTRQMVCLVTQVASSIIEKDAKSLKVPLISSRAQI